LGKDAEMGRRPARAFSSRTHDAKIMCAAIATLRDVDRLPLCVGSIAPSPSVSRSGPGLRVLALLFWLRLRAPRRYRGPLASCLWI
jgi:hypothetical protein